MRLPVFVGVSGGAVLIVVFAWWSFAQQRQEFEAILLQQERLLDQKHQELVRARAGKQNIETRRPDSRSHCADILLHETELRGEETSHHAASSAEACPALCTAESPTCVGWTFNAEEKLCRLKSSVASVQKCNICTSWHPLATANNEPEPLACRAPEIQVAIASAREVFERSLARASQQPSNRPKDIVLVVAWQRSAMLLAALDFVLRADLAEQHVYVFQLDHGFSPEVLAVACAWPLEKRISFPPPHREFTPANSNSYTVLEAYRYGEMLGRGLCSELLYLLEEDIFVARDFFRFHRAAHASVEGVLASERPKMFAVSAYHPEHATACHDALGISPERQARLQSEVFARQFYHSLGVSFRVQNLSVITQHAVREFYENREAYNEEHFGTLSIYHGTEPLSAQDLPEQDALIGAREYTVSDLFTLFPYCSRAFHAGYTGYNHAHETGMEALGSGMVEQYRALVAMTGDWSKLKELAKGNSDVQPVPLTGYNWTSLHCGYDLREDSPEQWAGSKCDLRPGHRCECHHFGGGWWWQADGHS